MRKLQGVSARLCTLPVPSMHAGGSQQHEPWPIRPGCHSYPCLFFAPQTPAPPNKPAPRPTRSRPSPSHAGGWPHPFNPTRTTGKQQPASPPAHLAPGLGVVVELAQRAQRVLVVLKLHKPDALGAGGACASGLLHQDLHLAHPGLSLAGALDHLSDVQAGTCIEERERRGGEG